MTLFDEEFEQEAITRIRKFAKIAEAMGFEVAVGFSGGKDSQVVYDLCRRACIPFNAYYNHAFESCTTMKFIREHYPDVIWRRQVKEGFLQNIWTNHNGLLPTIEIAYCCSDYKHNAKQVDACSIVGVRRAESKARANRKTFEVRNKTMIKKNKALFTENCTGSGSPSIIQLKPIVDWSDDEVWNYIKKYNLPINPEYATARRVGCVICPKAGFERNCNALMRYPKLIDAIIKARENANRTDIDWIVTSDKVEYVCRWLNRSFRPFSKKQRKLADMVKQRYNELKQNQ